MDRHSAHHTQDSFIRVSQLFCSAHLAEQPPSQAQPHWLHQAQLGTGSSCPSWPLADPCHGAHWTGHISWAKRELRRKTFVSSMQENVHLTAHSKATHFFFLGQNIIFTAQNSRTSYREKAQAPREGTFGYNGISSRNPRPSYNCGWY